MVMVKTCTGKYIEQRMHCGDAPLWCVLMIVLMIVLMSAVSWVCAEETAPTTEKIMPEKIMPEKMNEPMASVVKKDTAVLNDEVMTLEDIQTQILELNRDLFMLEEDLLFPPNTQVVVFVRWRGATFFNLDSIEVKIDDDTVAGHLYTDRQKSALKAGGIQRLYFGNLKAGEHEVTAVITGLGPEQREYRRAASLHIKKTTDPLRLALEISDDANKQQPQFTLSEWASE